MLYLQAFTFSKIVFWNHLVSYGFNIKLNAPYSTVTAYKTISTLFYNEDFERKFLMVSFDSNVLW